mgnify:CR=1 FL=1
MWINNTTGSRLGIKGSGRLCGNGAFLSEKHRERVARFIQKPALQGFLKVL